MKKLAAESVWYFDAPTGTFRNEVFSALVRAYVDARLVMAPHVRTTSLSERKRGETVRVITCKPTRRLPEPLHESLTFPESDVFGEVKLDIQEYGMAFPYQNLNEDFGTFSPNHPVQHAILDRGILIKDGIVSTALKGTPVKWIPGQGILTEDGTLTETAWTGWRARVAERLGLDNRRGIKARGLAGNSDFEEVVSQLHNYGAPQIDGCYFAFVGSQLAKSLMATSEFEAADVYRSPCIGQPSWNGNTTTGHPRVLERNEIGRFRWNDLPEVRFIEVRQYALVGSEEAIVFGNEAAAVIEATPLHLRAATPTDFGRTKMIAVYGLSAAGLLFTDAKNCRVIHLTEGPTILEFGVQLRAVLRRHWYGFKLRRREQLAGLFRRLATKIDGRIETELTPNYEDDWLQEGDDE